MAEEQRRSVLTGVVVFVGLVLLSFGFALAILSGGGGEPLEDGPRVGVVRVSGAITDSTARRGIEQLRSLRKDEDIAAIVLRIDSPGGMVGPSQEIYREVQRTIKTKPVVASMGSVAASGGYYIAAPCSRIVASPGTITGSIGVITQTPKVTDLLALARVQVLTVTSGELKDVGSPVRPTSEKEQDFLESFVNELYEQFLKDVAQGRRLKESRVRPIADGRVLSGRQAKTHGLVDQLGNFTDALELAVKLAGKTGEPVPVYQEAGGGVLEQLLEDVLGLSARALRSATASGARVEATAPEL